MFPALFISALCHYTRSWISKIKIDRDLGLLSVVVVQTERSTHVVAPPFQMLVGPLVILSRYSSSPGGGDRLVSLPGVIHEALPSSSSSSSSVSTNTWFASSSYLMGCSPGSTLVPPPLLPGPERTDDADGIRGWAGRYMLIESEGFSSVTGGRGRVGSLVELNPDARYGWG